MISCNLTNVDFACLPHLLCSPDSTSPAARSRISCVSFSRRTGFQSLSPGLHTDHRHRPGTSENTFLEFPCYRGSRQVLAQARTLARCSRNMKKLPYADTHCTRTATDQVLTLPYFPSVLPAAFLFLKLLLLQSLRKIHPDLRSFSPASLSRKASHRAVPRYV